MAFVKVLTWAGRTTVRRHVVCSRQSRLALGVSRRCMSQWAMSASDSENSSAEETWSSAAPAGPNATWSDEDLESYFFKHAEAYGLTEEKKLQFQKFTDLLLEGKKKVNITGFRRSGLFFLNVYLNVLTVLPVIDKYMPEGTGRLIDVGSGPGLPGIPIAIMRPDLEVTLNDCIGKKCVYHGLAIEHLGLENVTSTIARAEDLGRHPEYRESFDFSIALSVAKMSVLAEYILPLTKVGGLAIAMKTMDSEREEVKEGVYAIKSLGGSSPKLIFGPHSTTDERNFKAGLVVAKKLQPTLPSFPRQAGSPSRNPLM